MSKEVSFTRQLGTPLTEEEILMVQSAATMEDEYDPDNPFIDSTSTPELYAAMMNAVAERNRRVSKKLRELA